MTVLYLPVFRATVGYTVSFGRRWTVLEHMLLAELAAGDQTVAALAAASDLPERLIVEALINLLRAGWVEVRTNETAATFSATTIGRTRAEATELKPELQQRARRWIVCEDRLTGAWLRHEHLDLVHEQDLSAEATVLDPLLSTFDPHTAEVRDLLPLEADEAFERFEAHRRTPSRLFARVRVTLDGVEGLPEYAPLRLRERLMERADAQDSAEPSAPARRPEADIWVARDDIGPDDLIVGGPDQLAQLQRVLGTAKSHVVLHSCFLHADAVRRILPDLQAAAERKVKVDLLWGLNVDPETPDSRQPVAHILKVLDELPPKIRSRVHFAADSSGSHLKAIVADVEGRWETTIGSCNYLSSAYDLMEAAVRTRSARIATAVLGQFVDAQMPASGSWSSLNHRLNRSWNSARRMSQAPETGSHHLTPLLDDDHLACLRQARNEASRVVEVGCDLFGMAADTAALPPLRRAAERGCDVSLTFRRFSRTLTEIGQEPSAESLRQVGLRLERSPRLHAKYLLWDDDSLALTSFNWLSTVTGTRSRGAELGLLVQGPEVASNFRLKLSAAGVPTSPA